MQFIHTIFPHYEIIILSELMADFLLIFSASIVQFEVSTGTWACTYTDSEILLL